MMMDTITKRSRTRSIAPVSRVRTVYDEIPIPEDKSKAVTTLMQNPYLVIRELNNRSLHHFLRWSWTILDAQDFVDNWHIRYLCQELEKVAYRVGNRMPKEHDLLINVPPGSTKTRLISVVFPVWCWTKWPWMKFITASYSGALALESAEASRDIIKSDEFQKVYPEILIKPDKDTKTNYRIAIREKNTVGNYRGHGVPALSYGGFRFSTSVGGTLTGMHGDINIWDDPLNPQQSTSDLQLATANDWIDTTLPTRKTNKDNSVTIGIMQRLHDNDPTAHLLRKQKDNLKHICLPGELHSYREQVKPAGLARYYINGLFDQNRLSQKVLNELAKDLGPYGYAGQIGQAPAPAGGGTFKVDRFQMVNATDINPNDIVKTVRFWDKAATKNAGAFTAGVKMSRLRNNKIVLWDVKRGQWSSEIREKIIRSTAEADGVKTEIAVEQEPGSGGKESAENTIRNLLGFIVQADRPSGDKSERADPFSVQVNNGNVLMVQGEWNKDYKDELALFPNSRFKDQTDASSGGFNYLVTKKDVRRYT